MLAENSGNENFSEEEEDNFTISELDNEIRRNKNKILTETSRKSESRINSEKSFARRNSGVKKEEQADYLKGCALCTQQYPKTTLETKVMWKHVLDLRYVQGSFTFLSLFFPSFIHQFVYFLFSIFK